jgi:hypothetical protein
MKSPRRPLWIALGVVVAGVGIAAFFLWPRKDALPQPGSPEYLHYVRVFNLGVAAVDAGRDELAKTKLEEATEFRNHSKHTFNNIEKRIHLTPDWQL